jgi:hypothetical protein
MRMVIGGNAGEPIATLKNSVSAKLDPSMRNTVVNRGATLLGKPWVSTLAFPRRF